MIERRHTENKERINSNSSSSNSSNMRNPGLMIEQVRVKNEKIMGCERPLDLVKSGVLALSELEGAEENKRYIERQEADLMKKDLSEPFRYTFSHYVLGKRSGLFPDTEITIEPVTWEEQRKKKHYWIYSDKANFGKTAFCQTFIEKCRAHEVNDVKNFCGVPCNAQFLLFDEVSPTDKKLPLATMKGLTGGTGTSSAFNRKSFGSSYTPRKDVQAVFLSNHSPYEVYGTWNKSLDIPVMTAATRSQIHSRLNIFKLDGDPKADEIRYGEPSECSFPDIIESFCQDWKRQTNVQEDREQATKVLTGEKPEEEEKKKKTTTKKKKKVNKKKKMNETEEGEVEEATAAAAATGAEIDLKKIEFNKIVQFVLKTMKRVVVRYQDLDGRTLQDAKNIYDAVFSCRRRRGGFPEENGHAEKKLMEKMLAKKLREDRAIFHGEEEKEENDDDDDDDKTHKDKVGAENENETKNNIVISKWGRELIDKIIDTCYDETLLKPLSTAEQNKQISKLRKQCLKRDLLGPVKNLSVLVKEIRGGNEIGNDASSSFSLAYGVILKTLDDDMDEFISFFQ
jgi:hypothetical protein